VRAWGRKGSAEVIASDDKLYLCDGYNNLIVKTDLNGEVLGALGGPASCLACSTTRTILQWGRAETSMLPKSRTGAFRRR
jgi:hypothetical protein